MLAKHRMAPSSSASSGMSDGQSFLRLPFGEVMKCRSPSASTKTTLIPVEIAGSCEMLSVFIPRLRQVSSRNSPAESWPILLMRRTDPPRAARTDASFRASPPVCMAICSADCDPVEKTSRFTGCARTSMIAAPIIIKSVEFPTLFSPFLSGYLIVLAELQIFYTVRRHIKQTIQLHLLIGQEVCYTSV